MTALTEHDAAAGAYVQAAELRIWYTDQGQGPPLILVHGGLATGEIMWNRGVVAELARSYRVLIPDSRGHGRTDNPAGALSYPGMADDVAAFAAALGVERPLVLGYSDGAQIALELGLRHPGFARALVMGGVVTGRSPAYLQMLRELGFPEPGTVDVAQVEHALGSFYDTVRTAHHHACGPDGLRAYFTQISELWHGVPAYTDEQLASIREPSLVITGDRDGASVDDSLRLFRLLPRGELGVIPNAGHDAGARPVFWEAVRDFLSRHAGTENTNG